MSLNRYNPKRDANELEIMSTLTELNVPAVRSDTFGMPDLWTVIRGRWLPVEVKSPGGKLTPQQVQFHRWAEAARGPIAILSSVDQVAHWVRMMRK